MQTVRQPLPACCRENFSAPQHCGTEKLGLSLLNPFTVLGLIPGKHARDIGSRYGGLNLLSETMSGQRPEYLLGRFGCVFIYVFCSFAVNPYYGSRKPNRILLAS